MSAHFTVELDTTAPVGVELVVNGGAGETVSRDVLVGIISADATTTGYGMKLWGEVDPAANTSVGRTEAESEWLPFASAYALRLDDEPGSKHLYVRLRDSVWNESQRATTSITLATGEIDLETEPDPYVALAEVASYHALAAVFAYRASGNEEGREAGALVTPHVGTADPDTIP